MGGAGGGRRRWTGLREGVTPEVGRGGHGDGLGQRPYRADCGSTQPHQVHRVAADDGRRRRVLAA